MNSADPYTYDDFKSSNWNEFSTLDKLQSILFDQYIPMGGEIDLYKTIPVALGDIKYLLDEAHKYNHVKKLISTINYEEI